MVAKKGKFSKMNVMGRKGFTLIETIIVVAIVAALIGVVFGVYPNIKASQNKKIITANIQQILAGIDRYKRLTGQLPQTQQDFESLLLNTKYFESVPVNPYWNDNTNHPEKGWKWDVNTQSVTPVLP
jgi:prepilin-type N-terminal cleavage/methylation domain-containing protein